MRTRPGRLGAGGAPYTPPARGGVPRRESPVDDTPRLLRDLLEATRATNRLLKLSISLQAEALANATAAAAGATTTKALEKRVMASVRQIRATADRVEAGRALPR